MTQNAFQTAKSAALAALSTAAEQLRALEAATAAATSPQATRALRLASNELRAQHGRVAEAIRYLDQCASRPASDPVRAAMLRGDAEALRPALLAEVFEAVERDDSDPEPYMLLADVWPTWTREHSAEGAEMPTEILDGEEMPWMRLRDRWLPLVVETLRGIVDWYEADVATDRAKLAKLSRLAAEQLGGGAGLVVDEEGKEWMWTPGELAADIERTERLVANAVVRIEAAKAVSAEAS